MRGSEEKELPKALQSQTKTAVGEVIMKEDANVRFSCVTQISSVVHRHEGRLQSSTPGTVPKGRRCCERLVATRVDVIRLRILISADEKTC
jgi:hypothetical protein